MSVIIDIVQGLGSIVISLINIYIWVIIIAALLSFVNPDPYNPIVQFLHRITQPAYALVRSSEALGIFLGVFLGGYMTNFLYSKSIFINDIFCMLVITYLIFRNSSSIKRNLENFQKKFVDPNNQGQLKWNKNSTIIILSILLITTSLALIQVTLPLDLVKGGVYRNALSKEIISLIISIQLILLLFLQWPVGSWISKKERLFGLKFSLINFSFASFLLFISSYLNIPAFYLISLALILVSLGTASFLPTSTDVTLCISFIKSTSLNPPVDEPISRACNPATLKSSSGRKFLSLYAARET